MFAIPADAGGRVAARRRRSARFARRGLRYSNRAADRGCARRSRRKSGCLRAGSVALEEFPIEVERLADARGGRLRPARRERSTPAAPLPSAPAATGARAGSHGSLRLSFEQDRLRLFAVHRDHVPGGDRADRWECSQPAAVFLPAIGSPIGLPEPSSAARSRTLAPSMSRSVTVPLTGSMSVGEWPCPPRPRPVCASFHFWSVLVTRDPAVSSILPARASGLSSREVSDDGGEIVADIGAEILERSSDLP